MSSLVAKICNLQRNKGTKETLLLILKQLSFYFSLFVYFMCRYRTDTIDNWHDPFKIVWVDPNEINYVSLRASNVNRWIGSGTTEAGQWDLSKKQFEAESDWYRALEARFVDDRCWQEIDLIQERLKDVKQGETVWKSCTSEKEVLERCEEIDALYHDIKRNGYKSKRQLLKTDIDDPIDTIQTNVLLRPLDEVAVDIGRNGEFLFVDGRHRLSIAKIVGVDEIPVRIVVRHEKWQRFREQVYRFVDQVQGEPIRYELPHPDFRDIETLLNSNEWFDRLVNEFDTDDGIVVDFQPGLGGALSTRFDQAGFDCYAFQPHSDRAEILKTFKQITDSDYEIAMTDFDMETFENQHLIGILGSPSTEMYSVMDNTKVGFDELYLICNEKAWIPEVKYRFNLSLITELGRTNDITLYKTTNDP